jgi:hypothetical protein
LYVLNRITFDKTQRNKHSQELLISNPLTTAPLDSTVISRKGLFASLGIFQINHIRVDGITQTPLINLCLTHAYARHTIYSFKNRA